MRLCGGLSLYFLRYDEFLVLSSCLSRFVKRSRRGYCCMQWSSAKDRLLVPMLIVCHVTSVERVYPLR